MPFEALAIGSSFVTEASTIYNSSAAGSSSSSATGACNWQIGLVPSSSASAAGSFKKGGGCRSGAAATLGSSTACSSGWEVEYLTKFEKFMAYSQAGAFLLPLEGWESAFLWGFLGFIWSLLQLIFILQLES